MSVSCAKLLRRHWAFVALVATGTVVRLLAMVAYRPALFFSDSWAYLSTAFAHHLVALPYLRPVGYSILIRVLTTPGRDITQLIAIQHLAGVAIGTLVYATLVRARLPRGFAAAAAALTLLDGYAVTLEQYLMPDTLFALTLLAAALLLAWPRLDSRSAAPSPMRPRLAALVGLLLAAGTLQREVGLFAIPVVIIYLLWTRLGRRSLIAFLVALAIPLGSYATLMKAKTGVFGITATSGWIFYSRTAGFADCAGAGIAPAARPLCETSAERASHPDVPDWYMWSASSPAIRLFHRGHQSRTQRSRANAILEAFARRIVLSQPASFLGAIADDFLGYFTPSATPYADAVSATSLPRTARAETVDENIRRRVIPNSHPTVRSPAALVHTYRSLVHVPRPVLALLALLIPLGLALRLPARRETLLFGGTAILLLLGTSATAGFGLRYLLPAVPLLAIGGGLTARDLPSAILERSLPRGPLRQRLGTYRARVR